MATARWEFRQWQESPPPLPAENIEDRTDIYLLRPGLTARLVKLRDDHLDVKELIEVDGELQRWKPAACSPFPLDAGQVAAALCLNQGERRRLYGRLGNPADLIERLRGESATMIAEVFKRRVLGDVFDCRRETTQVRIAGAWYGSRALENVDADNLRRAMRGLGWPEIANESYGQRLLRALQPATAARSQRSP